MHFGSFFHEISERGDISVKTSTDILNIEHDSIEFFQLLRLWPPRFAVKRIDWEARPFIARVRNFLIRQTSNSMFRRKERNKLNLGGFAKNIDGRPTFAVASGVIGNKAHLHARKLLETVAFEHVDSGQNFCRRP